MPSRFATAMLGALAVAAAHSTRDRPRVSRAHSIQAAGNECHEAPAARLRCGGTTDRTVSLLATVGLGAPVYALSVVLLHVFGVSLGWFPVYGAGGGGFADRVTHLTLPAVAPATVLSAVVIRQTRAATLTVMRQDYITFARLRGLSPARVLIRYVLRNSAPPVVTSAGLLLMAPLSAGVFIGQVFSLPGAGSLLLAAVTSEDVPVVQGITLLLGALVVVINLLVDLLGFLLDPRVRLHAAGEARWPSPG